MFHSRTSKCVYKIMSKTHGVFPVGSRKCKKVTWNASPIPLPSFPPFILPLIILSSLIPSLPFPSLSLLLEVGLLIAARRPGERFSCPSGSGRSPAAKRYLVNFRLKISPLVATIFRSFSGNDVGETGWLSGTVVTYFTSMPDCQRSFQFKLRTRRL